MESSNHLHPEFLYWWIKATYTSPVLASWSIATRIIAFYRASHNGKIICSNGDYYSIIHQRLLLSIVIENVTQYNLQQILKKKHNSKRLKFRKKENFKQMFFTARKCWFCWYATFCCAKNMWKRSVCKCYFSAWEIRFIFNRFKSLQFAHEKRPLKWQLII